MTSATLQLILQLRDQASSGLQAIRGHLGGLADGAARAGSGVRDFLGGALQVAAGGLIQSGIEGIAGAIGDLRQGLIGGNAEMERYQTQFGVLLGGADAAKQRLAELAQFGATTPFELPQVVVADKVLQGFGLHAEDAKQRFGQAGADIRRIAGDVASGTGAGFEEIATYIGKFSSGATGEAIARFTELGIVTRSQLAGMGLSFDKGGALIVKSQADLDAATGVLLQAMQAKYGGMMTAQSATFEGMISNLSDWKDATLRTVGAPLFEVLKTQLGDLLTWLPSVQPQIEAFAQALASGVGAGMTWLSDTAIPALRGGLGWLTDTGLPALTGGWGGLAGVLAPVREALQPLIDGFASGGIGGALAALPGTIGPVAGALTDLRTELTAVALEGLGGLLDRLRQSDAFAGFLGSLGLSEAAVAGISATLGSLAGMLARAGDLVRGMGGWLRDELLPPVLEAGRGFAEMLAPHIAWLADFAEAHLLPALREVGQFLGDNLPGLIRVLAPLLTGLVDMGLSIVQLALMGIATTYETYLKPAFAAIGGWLEETTGGWDNLARGAEVLKGTLEGIAQAIRDIANGDVGLDQIARGWNNLISGNIQIPGFAGGVTGFRGGLAVVGERGPELLRLPGGSDVIPLTGGGAGGGGVSIGALTFAPQITADGRNARALMDELGPALVEWLERTANRNTTSGVRT